MSIPFTPWTPMNNGDSPATPHVRTPTTDVWSDRYRSWSTGNMGTLMSFPQPINYGETGTGYDRRSSNDLSSNNTVPPALGSPLISADPTGVWGPPVPSHSNPQRNSRNFTLEERLAAAEAKIRDLSFENNRLRDRSFPGSVNPSPSAYATPSISAHSSMFFEGFSNGMSQMTYGGPPGLGMRFEDEETVAHLGASMLGDDASNKSNYVPPLNLISSIVHGSFNYSDMPAEFIRPIVWVVAHRQPRNNTESAGLKAAVNALATRLGFPRDSEAASILITSIIDWARPLCFTSCGNYLCQQLLERGEADDKVNFVKQIQDDLISIASDKFGTHVLCKAIAVRELEEHISEAMLKHGIFESLKTGARRLWREYLERCRQAKRFDIFHTINQELEGKWAELACTNEHGSIAVQQVFEVFGSQDLMDPCFREVIEDISRVANNQFGHFLITKFIGYPHLYHTTCGAILRAYPPIAITHHGVNFAKIALTEGGRTSIVKYVDAICSQEDGRTPGIVAIATSSIGKAHLTFVLSCLTPTEHIRVRHVCRAYSTTLRNSQSGNDLLRSLCVETPVFVLPAERSQRSHSGHRVEEPFWNRVDRRFLFQPIFQR